MLAKTSAVLIAALCSGLCSGQEWSGFRGPGGSGVAVGDHAVPTRLDEASRSWRVPVPAGHSSPCVISDRIFLTGEREGALLVFACARSSGELLWERSIQPEVVERGHDMHSPASSTAVSDGRHVWVWFGSCGLSCWTVEGEAVWSVPRPAVANTFGSAASPVVHDGRLVLCVDQKEGSALEVFDAATGDVLWRKERPGFGSGWSTPMVWRRGEVDELVVYGVWWLTAYDLADGTERWSVPGLADEPVITPAHDGTHVFVTSYNMRTSPEVLGLPAFEQLLEELDADGDGAISRKESEANASILSRADADGEGDHPLRIFFRYLDRDRDGGIEPVEWGRMHEFLATFKHANALVAVKPGDGVGEAEIAWQVTRGVPECPSPLAFDGCVYVVKNGGLATCVDASTGVVHYQERLDSGGPYYASPVVGGGHVYAASARGVITVYQTGPTLSVVERNDLGERIMATPAIAGGVLYVRTESALHAFAEQ